jgi:uncharacterized protein (DUF2267 family)
MIRVRFHGRGGQGMKTASRIVGTAAFLDGWLSQDSPVYGAERRGAPTAAFVRIAHAPIRERGVIATPDLVVVADDTLLDDPAPVRARRAGRSHRAHPGRRRPLREDDRDAGQEDRMTPEAFYRIVMSTAATEDRALAKRATAAVFQTLRDRLMQEESDQVVAQLPGALKEVWEEGAVPDRRPIKLDRAEFFERVRDAAALPSTKEARWMTLAVFAALKEQLTPGEGEDVWSQLPKDLKEIWAEAQAT